MNNFKSKSPPEQLPGRPDPSLSKEGRKNFLRKIEDFICANCGEKVVGDGYTDHCPKCLWGKHVDLEIPGDRESTCRGLMKPTSAEFQISNLKFKIKYKCTKCRHIFSVREGKDDNRELLVELMNA